MMKYLLERHRSSVAVHRSREILNSSAKIITRDATNFSAVKSQSDLQPWSKPGRFSEFPINFLELKHKEMDECPMIPDLYKLALHLTSSLSHSSGFSRAAAIGPFM